MKKACYRYLLAILVFTGCSKDKEDFSYTIGNIQDLYLYQGSAAMLSLEIKHTGGTPETIDLSVSGLPPGVTAGYSAARGTPDFATALSFYGANNAAAGTYRVKIVATGTHSGSRSFELDLHVINTVVPALMGQWALTGWGQDVDKNGEIDSAEVLPPPGFFLNWSLATGNTGVHTFITRGVPTVHTFNWYLSNNEQLLTLVYDVNPGDTHRYVIRSVTGAQLTLLNIYDPAYPYWNIFTR